MWHTPHDVYVCRAPLNPPPSLLLTPTCINLDHLIYILAGTGAPSPFVMATIQYLIDYVCTVPAIYLVDKVGRRRALLAGSLVMMICLSLTGNYCPLSLVMFYLEILCEG